MRFAADQNQVLTSYIRQVCGASIVPDKRVKFGGPHTNRSQEISPHPKSSEATFSTVFRDNFRPDIASDLLAGPDVEQVGLDVCIKFGDSRSNHSRDIRLSLYDVRTTTTPVYAGHHIRVKRLELPEP